MGTIAYVDGFNLYFGVLKRHPEWKWLNLLAFMTALRPGEQIEFVRYFSAVVDPDAAYSESKLRQSVYVRALGSLDPKIKFTFGKYQERTVMCRGKCLEEYKVPEEKQTDVSIAVNMISDAIDLRPNRMVLVSGDSDLEPAVAWVRKRYPEIKITVYVPQLPDEKNKRRNDGYQKIGGVTVRDLPLDSMLKCQFPNSLKLVNGRFVTRPQEWK